MAILMKLEGAEVPGLDNLAELTPTFSVCVLYCHPEADPASAFRSLCGFLRTELHKQGQAVAVRCRGETVLGGSDQVMGLGTMLELGVDELYASVRERLSVPSWASSEDDGLDVVNQLTLALRRGLFVVLHTPLSDVALRKWLRSFPKQYRYLPSALMRGTFRGDGKTVWLKGVHRRRPTKADSKTLGGVRLQEALDEDVDASYAMSAAAVDYVPPDAAAVVRGRLTISPAKSRIYWKTSVDMAMFLDAAMETVDLLDKAAAAEPQEELFRQLAVPESDLANVRGAYDVTVAESEEMLDIDEDRVARAELLRNSFLEIRGNPDGPGFVAVVGFEGAEVGKLSIKPVVDGDTFDLDVRYAESPSWEEKARAVRDAVGGDLLAVYYESGHKFDEFQINLERQTAPPFRNLVFEDFTDYNVTQEKAKRTGDQNIHDAIGGDGDASLFAWVVAHFNKGWLVCDDGAGEIADFVHLAGGTLTVIHVKGAHNGSPRRQVAVTAFQEVVGQAVKNLGLLLDRRAVADRFAVPRIARPAAWYDGVRVADRTGFVDELRARTAQDKTFVQIVQPHLQQSVHDAAREAADAGATTRDSRSLTLLDGLLRSARRAVTARVDDLLVVGSA